MIRAKGKGRPSAGALPPQPDTWTHQHAEAAAVVTDTADTAHLGRMGGTPIVMPSWTQPPVAVAGNPRCSAVAKAQ